MGGGHFCCVVHCHACQAKCRGLSFIKLPRASTDINQNAWRQRLIAAISREDPSFNPDKAYICSRHFEDDCLVAHGSGRTLKFGSLPTKFLPKKSVETQAPKPRKPPTSRPPPPVPTLVKYLSLSEVQKDVGSLPVPWFTMSTSPETIQIGALDSECNLKYTVIINKNLRVSVFIYKLLAKTASLECQTVRSFLEEIHTLRECQGVTDANLQGYAPLPDGSVSFYRHVTHRQLPGSMTHTSSVRAADCSVVIQSQKDDLCTPCREVKRRLMAKHNRNTASSSKPLHPNTPLRTVSREKLANALKEKRRENSSLQKNIEKMKAELESDGVEVPETLHNDLKQAIEEGEITEPMAKLFWQEQLKAFKKADKGMRWHPMMIRLAILLRCQSPAAYATLRDTGVLKLPGESTLRDYSNVVHPQQGFNASVLQELCRLTADLPDNKRFVVLLHDEMSLKHDLVFDRRSGEVVGFVKPEKWIESQDNLATHVLVFMIVGINTSLKFSLGFFGTRTATADELYPLLWQAVGYLELVCGLKVIASTSDKGTPNQRLYRLHRHGGELCYKALNIYSPDRFLYFFSDAPHLVKTVRNNLASSGASKKSRRLWNNEREILWKHIMAIYNQDADSQLRRTRLTAEHVNLTSYSVMNVRLAAQVLSFTVSRVMQVCGGPESQETACFIGLMDRFFDCLNGRSTAEAERKRKPDLAPYRSVDDVRFQFLEQEFLGYLSRWKQAVDDRHGNFTKGERANMFLTYQTYEGLQMTVHSFIEATKYLLGHGVNFILSQVFCQDPLEEHFGRHRGMGRRAKNPTLWTFGYQEQKLMTQRTLSLHMRPRGNVNGKRKTNRAAVKISNSPLKKVRR